MKYIQLFLVLFLVGCGGGGASSSVGSDADSLVDSVAPEVSVTGVKNYVDDSGDAAFAFIDFEAATVALQEEIIEVKMELLSLNGPFLVDNVNVADDLLEYEWMVLFGEDQSIKLGLTHFKFPGAIQESFPNILDFVQKDLWVSDGEFSSVVAHPAVTVVGDEITITIERAVHSGLSGINMETEIRFQASYRVAGLVDVYQDQMK